MARETKLDDLREKRICDALKAGHSLASAARAGGIEERAFHYWRERGRKGEPRYMQFLQRTEAAEQEAEERCIKVIRNAMDGDDAKLATDTAWKWLERRRPKEWAVKREAIELNAAVQAIEGDAELILISALAAARSRKVG